MAISKDNLSSRTKLSAEQRAASTHDMAMRLIDEEVAAREKKTARLKQLRELHEASLSPAPPKSPRGRAGKSAR